MLNVVIYEEGLGYRTGNGWGALEDAKRYSTDVSARLAIKKLGGKGRVLLNRGVVS